MASNTSGTFIFYGGLLLLAIFICGASVSQVIPAIIALYFMLVATNSITRSENRVRRQSKQKHYQKQP